MSMQMIGKTMTFALILNACAQAPNMNSRSGPKAPAPVLVSQGLTLSVQSNANDALNYTFGAQGVTLQKTDAGGSNTFTLTRQAYVGSQAALSDADKSALGSLCQHVGLSSTADAWVEPQSWSSDATFFLHWRSHFSVGEKTALVTSLAALKAPIRCLLKIDVGGSFAYAVFDPIPVEGQTLAGTSAAGEAIDEGVMLIDQNPAIDLNAGQLLAIQDSPVIKPKIPALNSKDFQVQLNSGTAPTCRTTVYQGQTKVSDPNSLRNFQYGLKGEKAYTVANVSPQSISGRNLPTCAKIKTQAADKMFTADVACGDYRAIQDEGLEAGCQWLVEVVNPQDTGNGISYTVGMEKLPFETIDVSTIAGAATALPEAPNNPVRAKSTVFTGFSATQLASMEQAFDFWIAVSPASYMKYFDKFVTKVTYLARTGRDCSVQGVLAYVISLTSTEIFWCEAAGMSATATQAQNTPLQVLLIGVTAFHENLHTRGREHDFDAPNFQPCAGTSESALLSFDAIKTCTEDYCKPFKDYALSEYKAELDYSLEADARRFQGQCKTWNDGLGLKATDFRT